MASGNNSHFDNSPAESNPKKTTTGMNSKPFTLKKGSIFKKAE